jgi:hypothetical protein
MTARGGASWLALTVTQAVLLAVIAITMPVMGTEFTRPVPFQPAFGGGSNQPSATFSNSQQGAVFEMMGWTGQYYFVRKPHIFIIIWWRGIQPTDRAYDFAAFLVAPDGTTTEPVIWQPGSSENLLYPTTCWAAGDVQYDAVSLPLPENAPPGHYWISLAVFGDEAGPEGRLRVILPDGTQDVQIGIGPIRVEDVP